MPRPLEELAGYSVHVDSLENPPRHRGALALRCRFFGPRSRASLVIRLKFELTA